MSLPNANKISDQAFWQAIDELVATSKIVIDRPKNSPHPRFPEIIYPLDYGYLDGTVLNNNYQHAVVLQVRHA